MESFFPQLFFLSFVAPIILRLAIGGLFLYDAQQLWKTTPKKRLFAVASGVVGVLIAVGLFTQLAVVAAGVQIALSHMKFQGHSVFANRATILLSGAILFFLLIAGPGGIAFDLPY